MSSAVCASSMYSRLCMKVSSFLFVRACAVPRMLNLSCGIPFPVWTVQKKYKENYADIAAEEGGGLQMFTLNDKKFA